MCVWNWTTVWSVDWLMLLLILLSQIPDLYVCLELDDCVVC